MKNFKIALFAISFLTAGMVVSSCGDKSKSTSTEHAEMKGKEYDSAYVCPMHCEGSGSDEAGTCPVCGMDYVANADHKSDGHKHEDHSGHDH